MKKTKPMLICSELKTKEDYQRQRERSNKEFASFIKDRDSKLVYTGAREQRR